MLRIFGGDRIRGMMNAMRIDDKIPIESKMLVKAYCLLTKHGAQTVDH